MYNAAPTIHSKSACGFLLKVIEGHQFEIYGLFESADATMKFAHEHHELQVTELRLNLMDGRTICLKHLKLSNQKIYQAKSPSFQEYT